jgi:hypothetical protein
MESARISQLVAQAAACDRQRRLAAARLSRSGPCVDCSGIHTGSIRRPEPPTPSGLLTIQMGRCVGYTSPYTTVPGSIYTAQVEQRARDCALRANPNEEFERFFPPVCPPIVFDPNVYDASGNVTGTHSLGVNINANPATLQGKNCPLPNKPNNPVLPG